MSGRELRARSSWLKKSFQERLAYPLKWRFRPSAQSLFESGRVAASLIPRVRHRSEAVNIDRGQFVGRGLKDVAIVMDLHELAPVGGRAASR